MDPTERDALLHARILIVEDEGIVAKDLQNSLRALGYGICGTSPTGVDAIAKAKSLRPDLILMDIRLRGQMDGIEAARQIHQFLDVPIVFLTAYADPDTLMRAADVGPYAYVLKPFEDRELQVTLMMAMCKHRADAKVLEAERIAHEERLRASMAEEALRARDEFLSVAAHELRTPVSALQLQMATLAELVQQREPSLDDRIVQRCLRARNTVRRLASLIEGVLDVSQITLGGLKLKIESFDLAELIREVTTSHEELAKRSGSELRLSLSGPVLGRWDRVRIEQVLTNLLSNALKFGAGKPIDIELHDRGNTAEISIHDRGQGIDPDDRERILDRFERAVSHQHYGGLGLGLYIAGQIVKEHGGDLKVSSTSGPGATICVELPCNVEGARPPSTT